MELNQIELNLNDYGTKKSKCQACSGNTPKFDEKQITDNLSKLNSWSVNDEQKMIYKKFNFKTLNKLSICQIKLVKWLI